MQIAVGVMPSPLGPTTVASSTLRQGIKHAVPQERVGGDMAHGQPATLLWSLARSKDNAHTVRGREVVDERTLFLVCRRVARRHLLAAIGTSLRADEHDGDGVYPRFVLARQEGVGRETVSRLFHVVEKALCHALPERPPSAPVPDTDAHMERQREPDAHQAPFHHAHPRCTTPQRKSKPKGDDNKNKQAGADKLCQQDRRHTLGHVQHPVASAAGNVGQMAHLVVQERERVGHAEARPWGMTHADQALVEVSRAADLSRQDVNALGDVDAERGARDAHVRRRLVDGVVHGVGYGIVCASTLGLCFSGTGRGNAMALFLCRHPKGCCDNGRLFFFFLKLFAFLVGADNSGNTMAGDCGGQGRKKKSD